MSQHRATVEWQRNGKEFDYRTYSRRHEMHFDGLSVSGNAADGNIPASFEEHRALHHAAHEKCYIANSVKTEVVIEPC
jgi:organic hydroperoxide reductase OsmC/OhrA